MVTLFKSLVLPRLDYGSQVWSLHLVKHIDLLEKNQRSFTKHITGMQTLEYSERLISLKLYCDNLKYDLNSIYNWAVHNNMFLTLKSSITFHLVHLCLLIVIMYANPNMEIINPSDNVLDLGIYMSSNCSFEFHIQNLCKKCSNLSG